MKNVLSFFTSLSLLLVLNSCKEKGCTDPKAMNFNITADEDDGSCIICSPALEEIGSGSIDVFDNNFSSQHYTELVAEFTISQFKNSYNYQECGNSTCYFVIKVQSNVTEPMHFSYNLYSSGVVTFNNSGNVVIQGLSSIIVDTINFNQSGNSCGFFNSSSLFVSTGPIFYN
jgi:hypothetical protein